MRRQNSLKGPPKIRPNAEHESPKRRKLLEHLVLVATQVAISRGDLEDEGDGDLTYYFEDDTLSINLDNFSDARRWTLLIEEDHTTSIRKVYDGGYKHTKDIFNYAAAKRHIKYLEGLVTLDLLANA